MPNDVLSFFSLSRLPRDCEASNTQGSYPVENLPIATVRYDRNFCRVYANPAYLQIMVSIGAKILGKSVEENWWPTNISAKAYRNLLEEVMRTGKESEVTLEWLDGEERLVSYIEKLMPELDSSGEIVGVSVLVIDVSALRQRQHVEGKRLHVFERLARGDDLNDVLEQVAFYVEAAKPDIFCSIWVLDEREECLQMVVSPSLPNIEKAMRNLSAFDDEFNPNDRWLCSGSSAERKVVEDLKSQACLSGCESVGRELGMSACWSEPIFSSNGKRLGALCLYLTQAGEPSQDDSDLLRQAVHLSALSIERKRFEQRIHDQACYDPLTNLPNRRLFINRLHEEIVKAERGVYGLAVLFIDLDHFKEVNDKSGHEAGDGVLVEAAQRISTCVRESDTLARLGGDEFVIILPQARDSRFYERVAKNIVSVMQRPFLYRDHRLVVSASVGIAIYPADATDPEGLVHSADQAMYSAKHKGRNTHSLYSS